MRDFRPARDAGADSAVGGSNRDPTSAVDRSEGRQEARSVERAHQTHLTCRCRLARIGIRRWHRIRVLALSESLDTCDLVLIVEVHDEVLTNRTANVLRHEVVVVVPPRLMEWIRDH